MGLDALIYASKHHAHWPGAALIDRGQMLLCGVGLVFTTLALFLADALGARLRKLFGVFLFVLFAAMIGLYADIQNAAQGELDEGLVVWSSIGLFIGAAVLAG